MPPVHHRLQGGHVLRYYDGGGVLAYGSGAFGGIPGEEGASCGGGATRKLV